MGKYRSIEECQDLPVYDEQVKDGQFSLIPFGSFFRIQILPFVLFSQEVLRYYRYRDLVGD
ncbi:hypothetical protein [Neobacillus cucumis]|uniref:hypothetical protein n=1 Tax=Neobacillus cucumis TaxID=1740721 RepID=UPI001E42F709|nr:hypothetical protein [Neobacillus cucumis]